MRKSLLIPLCGLVVLNLVLLSPALGEKRIGVSPPNYGYVPIEPHSQFSGSFTVFNQGDEDLTAYAEVRFAPGNVTIEWQDPDITLPANERWKASPEVFIPVNEYRYGRFIISLGDLNQGQFYNWSIATGYIQTDPKPTAVAEAGFWIKMIWLNSPLRWYETGAGRLIILGGVISSGITIAGAYRYNKKLQKRDLVNA